MRAGIMFNSSGPPSPTSADTEFFLLGDGGYSTPTIRIYYDDDTETWYVYAGATQLGTFVLDVADATWRHFGIDVKIDSSSGWCYVFVDGSALLSYTGKTDYGSIDFDRVCFGPTSATYDGWNSLFLDDLYIDETTGEGSPDLVPLKRFHPIAINGDGNYSQWYGSDGNQASNYQLVNDTLSQSAAVCRSDFIESSTSGHKDSWTLSDSGGAITTESQIDALIVVVYANTRTLDGSQIRPFLRYSGTDLAGNAVDAPVAIKHIAERFTSPPGGGSWSKTAVDGCEIGIEFV